jgi:hypothetical protein
VTNVTKINPESGDVARFKIILKLAKADIEKNPIGQILKVLVDWPKFQTWWNSETMVNAESLPGSSTKAGDKSVKASSLIAFAQENKYKRSNLIGQEVAKYEIAFKPFLLEYENGQNYLLYDVSKAKMIGEITVPTSNVKLKVWSDKDLKQMTPESPIHLDSSKYNINSIKLTGPSEILNINSKKDIAKDSLSNSTAGNGDSQPSAASNSQATGDYTNLAKSSQKNQKVQDLQYKLLATGNADVIGVMAAYGADGYYGDKTATAIGKLIGQGPVDLITPEVSAKLNPILAKVTPEQLEKAKATYVVKTKPTGQGQPQTQKASPTKKVSSPTTITAGGRTIKILI